MNVVAVRHGQTIENRDGITQGQLPGRLTELGLEQAARVGWSLRDEQFDVIFCSDLERCVGSLRQMMRDWPDVPPVTYDARLREFDFGQINGRPASSWSLDDYGPDSWDRRPPGGESSRQVAERLIELLNEIYADRPDGQVLLCTHGGPIRLLRCLLDDWPFERRFEHDPANSTAWRFEMNQPLDSASSLE